MPSPIVSSIEIACPPAEVFAYATDPSRFAQWQDDVVSVQIEPESGPGVGLRYTTVRRIGATEQTMTQEVTESEPPHRWAVRGIDGPIRPQVTITVEPIGDGAASRVTFALDFQGHGIGVPLIPLVRRMAAKGAQISYANLKQRLEGP